MAAITSIALDQSAQNFKGTAFEELVVRLLADNNKVVRENNQLLRQIRGNTNSHRARSMKLIQELMLKEKEDFKAEVRKELGLRDDQECDKVCSALNDEQFRAMVDRIRKKLKRKLRGELELDIEEEKKEAVQMYA